MFKAEASEVFGGERGPKTIDGEEDDGHDHSDDDNVVL